MMNNLFIIFDPSSAFYFSLNWMSVLMIFYFMPFFYFNNYSRFLFLMKNLLNEMLKNISINIKNFFFKKMIFFMILFLMIWIFNFLSVFPYIFCPSSHFCVTLFLALPFWFNLMIMSCFVSTNKVLAHLVPLGAPLLLCPFMVVIETISLLIRPLTLVIRLTANMISGHILLLLLSEMLNNYFILFSGLIMLVLLVLEFSISFVQSYVFITLMSLYMSEV